MVDAGAARRTVPTGPGPDAQSPHRPPPRTRGLVGPRGPGPARRQFLSLALAGQRGIPADTRRQPPVRFDITLVRKAPVPPAIYLLAVVILGFATTLLRLPPLVDFLAAGFVLGVSRIPNLNLIGSLGDLGVAVLLLIIGLKPDLKTFARHEIAGTTHSKPLVGCW